MKPTTQTIPQTFGRYRILDKIGEGGMGTVYLAEDSALGRQVAIKVPRFGPETDATFVDRFYREAKVAAQIDHPNVCPVFDVGQIEGIHYLTMPYVEGTPLSKLVTPEKPWPPRQAVDLVLQIAKAVQAMHQRGLMHRDLKPSNILMRANGEPVLMDFGLARSFQTTDMQMTTTGAPIGTPSYMSPEQVIGDPKDIGAGTDVYSLGVILYQMVCGKLPFEGPLAVVYAQILHGTPVPPSTYHPGVDPQLDALCMKAMAKRAQDRFSGMGAFGAALARYLGPETVPMAKFAPTVQQQEPRLTCQNCGKSLRVPPEMLGRRIKCPKCQARIEPPGATPTPTAPLIATPVAVPIASPLEATVPTGPQPTFRESSRLPSRRRFPWLLLVLGAVVLISIIVLIVALSSGGKPTPEKGSPTVTNSLNMKLIRIEPGKYRRGSPPVEQDRQDDEDAHDVEITQPFYMGAHEVTVGQFREFIRATGYAPEADANGGCGFVGDGELKFRKEFTWENTGFPMTDDHPVVNVSWKDAKAFCEWLSKKEGKTYTLPTEAEWEYACRAGTTTRFQTGDEDDEAFKAANLADAAFRRRFPIGDAALVNDGFPFAAPVGSFKPNPWGLYDMHGNVWEWCSDWHAPYQIGAAALKDPAGPADGTDRVLRGGSWYGTPRYGRSADRFKNSPSSCNINFGFRVVLRVTPTAGK